MLVKKAKGNVTSVESAERLLFKKGFTVSNPMIVSGSTAEYVLKTEDQHRLASVKDLPDRVEIQYYDVLPDENQDENSGENV